MKKISTTLAAAALALGFAVSSGTGASAAGTSALSGLKGAAPQSPIVEVGRRHHHGRNVGLAILGAAAATAIIAGSARADRRSYRRHDSCEYLDYKCSQGYGWACRKYEYRCE